MNDLSRFLAPDRAHRKQPLPASFSDLSGVYAGWDRAQAWYRTPLSAAEIQKIKDAGVAKILTWRGPARFDERYIRRNVYTVPSQDALAVLRDMRDPEDVLVNIVEPGLSINFHDEDRKDESFWYAAQTAIKANHRDQDVRFVGGGKTLTRYSGPRYAPTVDGLYADRPCRFTGEIYCLHPDRRIMGAAACRRAGIFGFQDMVEFDHLSFWRKTLRLFEVDTRGLGRMFLNRRSSQRRRTPWVYKTAGGFEYDFDLRMGATLMRLAPGSDDNRRTNQHIVDHLRHILPVRRCLIPVDVEPILRQLALDYAIG